MHMPRGFSEAEKRAIGANLLAKGRELFGAHGLRRTNVEDLTRAVGISKGAFYLFYDSKEALFLAILGQIEAEYRAQLLAALGQPDKPPRERLIAALSQAVMLRKDQPLFAQLNSDEFAYLTRALTPEQQRAQLDDDIAFTRELIAAGRASGVPIGADPALATGLLRAIVMLNFHEDTIGRDVFADVAAVLIAQVADYLLKEPQP